MKKTFLVTVLAAALMALVSCASKGAAADEGPKDSEARIAGLSEIGAIDLATWQTADKFAMKYNADEYTLTCNGGEYFQFPLPQEMAEGDVITVHLTGVNNGTSGFRSWVVDQNQTTLSDPLYLDSAFGGLPEGEFDITYQLNATAPAMYLFIKGPQWGTMIEKLTLKSVAVSYN